MALFAKCGIKLEAFEVGSNDFGGPVANRVMQFLAEMTNGTGAYQNDLVWFSDRTLAASSTHDLDLAGSANSAFGQTITFGKMTGLFITVNPTSTGGVVSGGLEIGNADTKPYDGFLNAGTSSMRFIRAGGMLLLLNTAATGFGAVTGGSNDILRVKNISATNPSSYKICLLGRSA